MQTYDPKFEQMRLGFLRKSYPFIDAATGRVLFCRNEDGSFSNWSFEDGVYSTLLSSGFRTEFLMLLDIFCEYRSSCNVCPNNECIAYFDMGKITLTWLEDGSYEVLRAAK